MFTFSGKSDVGLRRTNNEDCFVGRPDLDLCVVADGMGGAAAGEVASRIFVETAEEIFSTTVDRSEEETFELVREVFCSANSRILDHVKENPLHEGMGCTAEVLAFISKGFVLGHVGDSRTYRYRNGQLKQLTQDHSLVQEQIDEGTISPEEARNHPFRNVILRAVGAAETVKPYLLKGKTLSGDVFLLCSDGLTDMVDDEQIQEVFSSSVGTSRFVPSAASEKEIGISA